jgi:RNA polymerase sigma-70 factor (ECF subfamily)
MPDERELGRKLRSGDRDAFDAIYQRYADRVMGFALRLCGDRTEAEDLVQEVFLAAYAARGEFRG